MQFAYILIAYKVINMNQDEQNYLKHYNPNDFDRPSITVDIVILTIQNKKLKTLITKRTEHPYKNQTSLIGGFVNINESLDNAANRILEQKGKLKNIYLEQLYTFGNPNRDPRMRIISVSYYALVEHTQIKTQNNLKLYDLNPTTQTLTNKKGNPKTLAFDHQDIINMTLKRIKGKLEYVPIGFELLPERFTLRQVQEVHEIILGKQLNKDAFRRKLLASKLVEATGEFETGKGFRPAEYYVYAEKS